jgi:hypothetical protein
MTEGPRVLDPEDKEETTPDIDLATLLTIHRGHDDYVGFVRKPDPNNPPLDRHGKPKAWESLCSIRLSELQTMFPKFVEWLANDSYFTVSAYYKPAPYKNPLTGLPDVWRKEKYLSKLPACYADIDCGRPESEEPGAALTWRQAQHEAELLADSGVIPQPSIMAHSGRGVYLFWLLHDPKDPTKPPDAWPDKILRYKDVNRALGERLRSHRLPADPLAHDAARVLRMPGSIHRKALRRVKYVIQLDENGKGFTYTLPELATMLELPPAPGGELPEKTRALAQPPQYRKVKNPGSAPLRSAGPKTLNALRAADLLTIQAWRGGFLKRGMKYPDGHSSPGRRLMLAIYADFLKGSRENPAAALKALHDMAANMKPPYPSDPPDQDPPIEDIIKAAYSRPVRKWKNEKLCKLLGITEEVARSLELQTIRPPAVAHEADLARPHKSEIIKARRAFAKNYLDLFLKTSARKLAKAYREAGFIGVSAQTANRDLNAIGYNVNIANRSRGGRPRKDYQVGK